MLQLRQLVMDGQTDQQAAIHTAMTTAPLDQSNTVDGPNSAIL